MSATVERCRSCKAPIVWARTPNGKMIPLDEAECAGSMRGSFVLVEGDPRDMPDAVPYTKADTSTIVSGSVHISHFGTCPEGKEWSRG